MEAAGRLPSPFRLREWPDPDVDFVLHAVAVWRQHLASYSAQCRRVLTQVSKALQPLETALATFRCVSASRVAAQKTTRDDGLLDRDATVAGFEAASSNDPRVPYSG